MELIHNGLENGLPPLSGGLRQLVLPPLLSPAEWRRIADNMRAAQTGAHAFPLMIHTTLEDKRRASLDARFGANPAE